MAPSFRRAETARAFSVANRSAAWRGDSSGLMVSTTLGASTVNGNPSRDSKSRRKGEVEARTKFFINKQSLQLDSGAC